MKSLVCFTVQMLVVILAGTPAFAQNRCVEFYQESTISAKNIGDDHQAFDILEMIQRISENELHKEPAWISRLAEDAAEKKAVDQIVKSIEKNGPSTRRVMKLTARLYRYRLKDAWNQIQHNAGNPKPIFPIISDEVLERRLERGIGNKGVLAFLNESGLLTDSSQAAWLGAVVRNHKNKLNIATAALLSLPAVAFGNVFGIFLPKVEIVSAEKLADEFTTSSLTQNQTEALSGIQRKYGKSQRFEIGYNIIRKMTNTIVLLTLSTAILGSSFRHLERIQADAAQAKELIMDSQILSKQTALGSPEEEAKRLLAEFKEQQNSRGQQISEVDEAKIETLFRTSFEKGPAK